MNPIQYKNAKSKVFQNLIRTIEAVSNLEINILLTGESGTGKTHLAKYIHTASNRSAGPFIEVNCAAIPEMLVESEFFGASKGAHSSAFESRLGKIAAAEKGTLFLDEINLMPLEIQAKILQFLNSNEYYPLGSSKLIKSDVRIICASNCDLGQLVQQGKFRQDLFYRVTTFPIELPTLRSRQGDIEEFCELFRNRSQAVHKLPEIALSETTLQAIQNYSWPGNIRELLNKIESACIRAMADGSQEILPKHLDFPRSSQNTAPGFKHATKEFQRVYIIDKLELFDWNISKTAIELDLSRGHLHSLMNSLEIEKELSFPASNDGTIVELHTAK